MAIRTYQKRANAAKQASENIPLPPPPSSIFLDGKEVAKTPPWRKRAGKLSIDIEDHFDDDKLNESTTSLDDSFNGEDALSIQFARGKQQDRTELQEWLKQWLEAPKEDDGQQLERCVPADWTLERQMRYAAWLQLLGLTCRWEGGYLWVETSRYLGMKILKLYSQPLAEIKRRPLALKENNSPLPAAPPPRRTTMGIEARLAALQLDEGDAKNNKADDLGDSILGEKDDSEDDGEHTMDARNRPRKWQHQADRVSSDKNRQSQHQQQMRRSSIGSSIVPLEKRISRASAGLDVRRSSIAAHRRSSLQAIREEDRTITMKQNQRRKTSQLDTTGSDTTFAQIQSVESGLLLKQILSHLRPTDLLRTLSLVSKQWKTACNSAANSICSVSLDVFFNSNQYFSHYANADFLAEGAYKSVFRVRNPVTKELEAVSVMDCEEIARVGDVSVVAQEVSVSLLLSDLVTNGICPNFIETKRVFRMRAGPPSSAWGGSSSSTTTGRKKKSKTASFQYIQMELCELGDMESYMKTLNGGVMALEASRSSIFQMIFAMYASRRAVKLRHYDVKLLNFFVKRTELDEMNFVIGQDASVNVKTNGLLVKLADYGTSDVDSTTLGKPVDVRHFTTLENTPPEFLLFSDAVQSFAADTFQLGLSVLHVLTGALPYEEILQTVQCPVALMDAVSDVWESSGKEFETLRCVLRDDDDNVLYHTLYRYLVLFGCAKEQVNPLSERTQKNRFDPSNSKVFKAARDILGCSLRDTVLESAGKSLKSKNIRQARKQFTADRAKFGLEAGTHHLIARARDRGQALGVWEDILLPYVQFDPEMRPTMQESLRSRAFKEWMSVMPISDEDARRAFGIQLGAMEEEMETTF